VTLVPSYILPIPEAFKDKKSLTFKMVRGAITTIFLLAFTGFTVFLLTENSEQLNDINALIIPAVLFTIKTVIPKIVEIVVKLENWNDPELEVNQIMVRSYFLKMSNIYVLQVSLTSTTSSYQCTEAVAGLLLYNMIITNSLLTAASNFASYGLSYCALGKTEIAQEIVAGSYVDMNYNQCLFLMGLVYCPALPPTFFLLNWFEMFILFISFKWFCKLAKRPFEPQNVNSTFWYLLLTTCIGAATCAQFLYAAPSDATSNPDLVCGPFNVDNPRYYAVSDWFHEDMPGFINTIFSYLLNPMFVYVICGIIMIFFLFENAQKLSVREICIDAQWQLRVLTRRLQSKAKATKSNEGAVNATAADLDNLRKRHKQKTDEMNSVLRSLRERARGERVARKQREQELEKCQEDLAKKTADAKRFYDMLNSRQDSDEE